MFAVCMWLVRFVPPERAALPRGMVMSKLRKIALDVLLELFRGIGVIPVLFQDHGNIPRKAGVIRTEVRLSSS